MYEPNTLAYACFQAKILRPQATTSQSGDPPDQYDVANRTKLVF